MRRILVSGHCQAIAVAAAFRCLFPDHSVDLVSTDLTLKAADLFDRALEYDYWVASGPSPELMADMRSRASASPLVIARLPSIMTTCFHPDIYYMIDEDTEEILNPHYNSAIDAWCYRRGVPVEQSSRLFNTAVFADLGYLDRWVRDAAWLLADFERSELDGRAFLAHVKRHGTFMHTPNHPKAWVSVYLAKMVAVKLGLPKDTLQRPVDIVDPLIDFQLPVLPGVAEHYGVRSSTDVVFKDATPGGFTGFLRMNRQAYDQIGLANRRVRFSDLRPMFPDDAARRDRVMADHLRRLS